MVLVTATAQLAPIGCAQQIEGIAVSVIVAGHPSDGRGEAPGSPLQLIGSNGTEIQLQRAYVVLRSLALVKCPNAAAELWQLVAPISTAHAHSVTTPLRSGTPAIAPLATARATDASTEPRTVATLRPPPGRYCAIVAELGPADSDTPDLPRSVDLVGRTLYLEGSYRDSPNAARKGSFEIDSRKVHVKRLALEPPLELDARRRRGRIRLGFSYDDWFDGVDLFALDAERRATAVLRNVVRSLHRDRTAHSMGE